MPLRLLGFPTIFGNFSAPAIRGERAPRLAATRGTRKDPTVPAPRDSDRATDAPMEPIRERLELPETFASWRDYAFSGHHEHESEQQQG